MFVQGAHVVSIDCSKERRSEGSQVSGSIKLNTNLAKEKEITAVRVSLKATVNTYVFSAFSSISNTRQSLAVAGFLCGSVMRLIISRTMNFSLNSRKHSGHVKPYSLTIHMDSSIYHSPSLFLTVIRIDVLYQHLYLALVPNGELKFNIMFTA
jgi:hypothetical protein